MKKLFGMATFLLAAHIFAADLTISANDLLIRSAEGGALLLIRKKQDIRSVLLCETTKDPTGQMTNYTFRDSKKNPFNGEEKRILDGKELSAAEARWPILSSTVVQDGEFGECFVLFLPETMQFGYDWSRNGTQKLEDGMFVNVRTFEKPFADYTGEFCDNPFQLNLEALKTQSVENYNAETVSAFQWLAKIGGGISLYSSGPADLPQKIDEILSAPDEERNLDLAFVIDATRSMTDDFEVLRAKLIPQLSPILSRYENWRIGLIVYKDYGDEFADKGLPVKIFPFTSSLGDFEANLRSFKVFGGKDYEEAVYEGVFAACEFLRWRDNVSRKMVLIGDAEPHSTPRGTGLYGKEIVERTIEKRQVRLNTIILYDPDRKK